MKINIFDTDKKYRVIYADPPWEYKQSGSAKNSRGMAKQHYSTMNTTDICNLPVRNIATEDAILFMWATFPNLGEALAVMEAWGFIYKTAAFVWVKTNRKADTLFWGMGAYTRANAEVCLLGISKKTKASEVVNSHKVHQIVQAIKTIKLDHQILTIVNNHKTQQNKMQKLLTQEALMPVLKKINQRDYLKQEIFQWEQ